MNIKKIILISVLFCFAKIFCQGQSYYDAEVYNTSENLPENANKNNYLTSPGYMMHNGKEMPTVIAVQNGASYLVTNGFFNGTKKMISEEEIKLKLNHIVSSNFNYLKSIILISDNKPFLITIYKNEKLNDEEKIIIQLKEENNFLIIDGLPIKKTTINGKTKIKVCQTIVSHLNDYVGHLTLLR